MIASGSGLGQAVYGLAVIASAAVLIAWVYRPRITSGRRTTKISIGRFLRAILTDDGRDELS